jgi:hypothetical protein
VRAARPHAARQHAHAPAVCLTLSRPSFRCCAPPRLARRAARATRSYLLAEGPGALYVAFIGTKQPRDLLADVNAVQAPLWEAAPALHHSASSDAAPPPRLPRCHAGFLARARAIPIVHLYDEARRRRRRLVLCGHSLGGAVAAVSAVRLLLALRALPGEGAAGARGGTAADDALPLVRSLTTSARLRMTWRRQLTCVRSRVARDATAHSCVSFPLRSRR